MASMRNAGLLARLLKSAAADQRLWPLSSASPVRIPWFCSSRFWSSSSSPRLAESAPPAGAESAPATETESAGTESAPPAGAESAPATESESAGTESAPTAAAVDTDSAPVAETESTPAEAASDAVTETAAKADEFPAVKLPGRGPVLLKGLGKMTNNRAIRDYKRRLCVAKHENERMQYKAITHDRNLPYEIRRYFQGKLSSLPRNSSRVRIRNRCIITGRPRSVYRKFRISRICLRELACHGELMGVYKASW